MIKPVNPYVEVEYVPWGERHLPVEEQTVFILMYPDAPTTAEIEDESIRLTSQGDKSMTQVASGSSKYKMLQRCLKGWKNFGEGDEAVAFNATTPKDLERSISRIPANTRDELYNELRGGDGNQPLKDAAKEKGVLVG